MNPELPGQILSFVFTTGAWFLAICYFGLPLALAYWKAREKQRAADTELALSRTRPNTSHQYEMDAM